MNPSVLIIENNPASLDMLCMHVKDCGFKIYCAEDLETAMSRLRNHRLSIAIVDWELPGGEALEIIQLIRSNHRIRRTHILVVSSMADPSIVETAMSSGADDFFTLPIGASELRARLVWATSRSQLLV